jgi:septal ring factor EnvC (AmiA/AmiB activator)
MSSGLPKPSTSSRVPIRIKSEELSSTIESIVNDYETCINENSGAGKDAKETISKLEEKVENLQARNEKLMIEKSTLLEKHADMLQMGADSSNKTFALQQEAENLRREKMQLEVRINDLSNALERSLNASRTSDEDKNKQAQFEREILSLTALEKAAQEENNRLKLLLEEEQSNSKKLLEDLSSERNKNTELSEEIIVINGKLSASLEEAKIDFPIDVNSDVVQTYVNNRIQEEISKIQNTLTEVETNLASVMDDNARLLTELETLNKSQTSQPSLTSTSPTSAEELKSIMQDVYVKACEIFVPSDDNDTPSYSSQDIVKRLRSVLKSVTNERSK